MLIFFIFIINLFSGAMYVIAEGSEISATFYQPQSWEYNVARIHCDLLRKTHSDKWKGKYAGVARRRNDIDHSAVRLERE